MLTGPTALATNAGYTGTGFIDFTNNSADGVQWTFDLAQAGRYGLNFRYALQSGSRPLKIEVNGQVVSPSLNFASTGAWTTWIYASLPSQLFQAGTNTVKATAIGSNGPNIDHLLLNVENADFNADGSVNGSDLLVWQRNLGTGKSLAQGDANGDGAVTTADLAILKVQFGTSSTGATAAGLSVPEPIGLPIVSAAAIGLLAMVRRRLRADCVPQDVAG